MRMKARMQIILVLLVFPSLALVGCGVSRTPQYYTLSPIGTVEKSGHKPGLGEELSIGVGPVEFPEYLDRPQIVTRAGENEMEMAEFHRWAEPLKKDFSRALAENLAVLLHTEEVFVLPWSRTVPLDHTVVMAVIRFEGSPGGAVELIARWGLLMGDEETPTNVRKSSISEPTDGSTYEALVAAHSRALVKLSREIADAIAEQPR